jgi:hypothetical protein
MRFRVIQGETGVCLGLDLRHAVRRSLTYEKDQRIKKDQNFVDLALLFG